MGKVGHLQPYGDGWRIFVERRGRKRTEVFRGTRRAAEIRAAQIAAEMGVSDPYPDDVTVEDYWREVFPSRPSNRGRPRSSATMAYYADQMRLNILPKIGSERLRDLSHEQLSEVVRSSSAPVNTKRTLMAVLRSAYDDGLMPRKPLERRVALDKRTKARYSPWTPEEALEALQALMGRDSDLALYAVAGLSGLGMEEALGLRWRDVQLSPPAFRVSWTYTDRGGHVEAVKNAHRARTVPVLVAGRGYLASQAVPDPHDLAAHEARMDSRIIPLRGDVLYKRWKAACADLGLRFIPPSNLRHTSDTLMLAAGVRSELNDKMHGRSNPKVTYSAYYRPSHEDMEEAAQILGAFMAESHTSAHQRVENLSQGQNDIPF